MADAGMIIPIGRMYLNTVKMADFQAMIDEYIHMLKETAGFSRMEISIRLCMT